MVKEESKGERNKKDEQRKSLERVSSQAALCHIYNKEMTFNLPNPVSNSTKNKKYSGVWLLLIHIRTGVPLQPPRRTVPALGREVLISSCLLSLG